MPGWLEKAKREARRALDRALRVDDPSRLGSFELSRGEARARMSRDAGPLERMFFEHQGSIVHKWVHYLPVYDQFLTPYRDTDVHLLEIGVNKGGSLQLWRQYLGREAVIYGIDVNPACAERVSEPNQVRIGSQADPKFLDSVLEEMGRIDIVFDDGSHRVSHQEASLRHLFPRLADGGLYGIEDLHTSYWRRKYGGGYRRPGTGIEMVKALIDDMHGWYHTRGSRYAPRDEIEAVTVFDSIAMIRKRKRPRPGHVRIPARNSVTSPTRGSARTPSA